MFMSGVLGKRKSVALLFREAEASLRVSLDAVTGSSDAGAVTCVDPSP